MAFICEGDDRKSCGELSAILLTETVRSPETEELLAQLNEAETEPAPSITLAEALTAAAVELGSNTQPGVNPYDAIAENAKQEALGWCIGANAMGIMCPTCPLRQHLPSDQGTTA